MAVSPDTGAWMDFARQLAPVIAMYRDQSEQDRRMAPPLFEAIRRTGLLDMLVPGWLGGPQADYEAYLRAVEELSRLDGSTGWNVMIWAAQGLFADYLDEPMAREVFGGPGRQGPVAGAVSPSGSAVAVPGGYEVSGRWSFASGCDYAGWLVAGCVVIEGEAPRMLEDDAPDIQVMLLRATECRVLDTWRAAGLRGTGSHDFETVGVFVPEERAIPASLFFRGPGARPHVVYHAPFYDLACPQMAAVAFGIARDAIESFTALAATRTPAMGAMPLAGMHTVQQSVGKAEALVRSGRAYVYGSLRRYLAQASPADADAADLRLAVAYATQCAVEAVDLMFQAAGGASVYANNRLERCFRDVHMVTHHMMASPLNIEMVGQYLLGGPLQVRR